MSLANDLVEKGVAAYARGCLDEAERLWSEALAVDPDSDRARLYLKQLREVPASDRRAPGPQGEVVPAPSLTSEPAQTREPPVAEQPVPPPDPPAPRDPARFSVPPEKMTAFHRSAPSTGARKWALLAAAATAILVAIAWGLSSAPSGLGARSIAAGRRAAAAATAALSSLPGRAESLLARWRKVPGAKPPVASSPVKVPAPPLEPRDGGSSGRKSVAPVRSGGPAVGAAPATFTVAMVELGTHWGMAVEELLKAVPGASRIAQPRRYEGLLVQASVDRVNLGGHACRADFMFDHEGRLAEIQFRSAPFTNGETAYDGLRASLAAELGEPATERRDPSGKGKWTARASWVTDRAAVELEVRRLGASEAPMFQVDLRGADLKPLYDSIAVLTLVSPGDPRSLANTAP